MPPALCIRFLVTNLTEYGWEPIVITTDPKHYEHKVDLANLQMIAGRIRVIRVGSLPICLAKRIGFSDLGIRSLWHYWNALSKLCKSEKIDAVLVNMPPFVPMVLGRLAYMRFRIPYILNYTDPWRTDYFRKIPKDQRPSKWRLAEWMANTLEPFAVRNASSLIGVSRATTDMVIANYQSYDREHTYEVPCGVEPRDAEYIRQHPRANPVFQSDDGLIHISSTGHFNPVLRHAAEAFFDGLVLGLAREPALFARVRVHFIGTTYASQAAHVYQVLPIAHEKGVEHLVTEHPERVSYLDSLQIMADSHGLLMLGNPSPHYTASKLFPYILSRRLILALFHEQSSVVKILDETQAGLSVTFSDERPLSHQIETIYHQLVSIITKPTNWEPPTRWDAFEQYTAQAMARRLAEVLDKTLAEQGDKS